MAYWWVNHNKMHKAELAGEYIWCPQNTESVKRVGYANLTLVRVGDVVFSYANQKVGHIGIAASEYACAARPQDKGYSDKQRDWQDKGWRVPVVWEAAANAIAPKQHLAKLAPYPGQKHGALRETGDGKEAMYLSEVPLDVGDMLMDLLGAKKRVFASIEVSEIERNIQDSELKATEKKALIDARIGQGRFRRDVINLHKACPITGVTNTDLLIASHIKAWKSNCTNHERLDPYNGLLLAPHVDKLFDRGFISFFDDGALLVRDHATKDVLKKWGISPGMKLQVLSDAQKNYMTFHRTKHKLFNGQNQVSIY